MRRNDERIIEEIKLIEKQFTIHDKQDTENYEKILSKIELINTNHNAHLQIYADNGVESKRVADILQNVSDAVERLSEQYSECHIKVTEMHKKYTADAVVGVFKKNALQAVMLVGGAVTAIVSMLVLVVMLIAYMIPILAAAKAVVQ